MLRVKINVLVNLPLHLLIYILFSIFSPSQNAKLQCILNFFDRVASEWERLAGSVIFIRQVKCILNIFYRVASEWERLTGSVIFIRQVKCQLNAST